MRLIDADELIKDRVENDPVRIAAKCAPTAYDIDGVVDEIKELGGTDVMKDCGEDFIHMQSVIKIVKGGVK